MPRNLQLCHVQWKEVTQHGRQRGPAPVFASRGPSGRAHPSLPLGGLFGFPGPLLPPCSQVCLYLVAEVSNLQGIGPTTVSEVQAVVTFRGETALLGALQGDTTS